jgi:phosphoglycolate phosphatase-like HAD superfamily hydrolase
MRLTNKMQLPAAIVEAVKNDGYTRGDADISVTQLVSPPQKVALEREYADQLVEDASDRIWSLMGQSIHTILERANRTGLAERRLSAVVEGWKVSGGMDLYDEDGVLVDYKTTSAWSARGGVKDEWLAQLNIYAHILRANGHPVKGLRVVAILRDWSKLEASRSADYPQSQVAVLPVEMWSPEVAEKYVRDRVILHKLARQSLPSCTGEERWQKAPVFALMKHGRKTAVKLYDNLADAEMHAKSDPASLYVQTRAGESTRCRLYCSASKFCPQYQSELNGSSKAAEISQKEEGVTA